MSGYSGGYTGTPTYSGWTCQQCGSWVPSGCTHSCPSAVRWMNPPTDPVYQRIAAALERIAVLLETQAEDKS